MAEFNLELIPVPHYKTRKEAEEAVVPQGGIGVELGVMRGNHAAQLLETTKPSKLYLVDPWIGQDARHNNVVNKFKDDERVEITRDKAQAVLPTIDGEVDWIVHDTAQFWPESYEDLAFCNEKLKTGGLLFFDYCYKDRRVGFEKFLKDAKNYEFVAMIEDTTTAIFKKLETNVVWATRGVMYSELFEPGLIGAEVGVLGGRGAQELIDNCNPSLLYLIDLWDGAIINYSQIGKSVPVMRKFCKTLNRVQLANKLYNHVNDKFKDRIDEGSIKLLRGSAAQGAKSVPDDSLDWVFIDAGHDYDNVIQDLETYYPKVKSGGYITGHDYSYRIKSGGVIFAVTDFMLQHKDIEFVGLTNDRSSPSFALRKV